MSLNSYITMYLKNRSKESDDVFTYVLNNNPKKLFRGEYKSYQPINTPKTLNGYNINSSKLIIDPLEGFTKLSEIQTKVLKCIPQLPFSGTYCYTAACGSGKTRAALKIIKETKLKTLIISARNAVNDQWLTEIHNLYPNIKATTRLKSTEYDIIVTTPQYLCKHLEDFMNELDFFKNLQVDLIIYDELHSLLSEKFSLVLALPFMMKMKSLFKQIPYLIGLTASLPAKTSADYKIISRVFGIPISTNDDIRSIPIKFIDYRDTVQHKGKFDVNYVVPSDEEAFNIFKKYIDKHEIKPTNEFKMIIMCGSISSSIYCAMQAANYYQTNALIIRANNEKDLSVQYNKLPAYYIDEGDLTAEEKPSYKIEDVLDDNKLQEIKFLIPCNYHDVIDNCSLIVGTYHRLKEGFNCPNIVYGLCTKFIWSTESRIQILGRIRRKSTNATLNQHERLFLVCSGVIPSNIKNPHRFGPIKLEYDLDRETILFKNENYNREIISKW